MWRIVTYKILAKGTPIDDEGKLNRLCSTMNSNPEADDVIYRVEPMEK